MAQDNRMLQMVLDKITVLDKKTEKGFKEVRHDIKKVDKRLDAIGSQVAYLEDDAPTRSEHDDLDKRVTKIEGQIALN